MSQAQEKSQVIYDEEQVPAYTLPDPLVGPQGESIDSPEMWNLKQRPHIQHLFETHVYGKAPEAPTEVRFEVTEPDTKALDGLALRKQVAVQLTDQPTGPKLHLLIYKPADIEGPVPAFLALNFYGNQSIADDPGIHISESWMRNSAVKGTKDHRASEKSRGVSSSRWPVREIVQRGYALVTAYYGDIDPDFDDGFENGIHPYFDAQDELPRPGDAWGSIAAWAWGLSRAMDYCVEESTIDSQKVIVMGHSRLGKTALWAGATDLRFAAVISNNSGCGGAALSRRRFGESVQRINTSFPHWFCGNFKKYNHNEAELPVDQHMLVALIAPRPVFVASAEEDRWADPRGEFLSAKHASPVYELLGVEHLATDEMPSVDEPVLSRVAYVIRSGKHDVLPSDWQRYMTFADRYVVGTE